jgi:hypothetical protein
VFIGVHLWFNFILLRALCVSVVNILAGKTRNRGISMKEDANQFFGIFFFASSFACSCLRGEFGAATAGAAKSDFKILISI